MKTKKDKPERVIDDLDREEIGRKVAEGYTRRLITNSPLKGGNQMKKMFLLLAIGLLFSSNFLEMYYNAMMNNPYIWDKYGNVSINQGIEYKTGLVPKLIYGI